MTKFSFIPDKFGVINEDFWSIRSPRTVDDTATTLEEAMATALTMLRDGAEKVSICTARYRPRRGLTTEVDTLILMHAYTELGELDGI